jgi:hypothetical protein
MKTLFAVAFISATFAWACVAQEQPRSEPVNPAGSGNPKSNLSAVDQAGYYAMLNRRVIEYKAQSELLSQLAQEHKKRAEGTAPDQTAKVQWENELARELTGRSAVVAGMADQVQKERVAFEQTHPDLVASLQQPAPAPAANTPNTDEILFFNKIEERLSELQQDIANALDAGKVLTAQLHTNTGSFEYSRIASVLQQNDNALRQLQKEERDLELRRLEFRALRRN